MRNLELKASFPDLNRAEAIAQSLSAKYGGDLHQLDTYFVVPAGRLKLREINHAGGELIFYNRPEDAATRWSDYHTSTVAVCAPLRAVLSLALGIQQSVEKHRRLYLYKGARIHLDNVPLLGSFVEFEVPASAHDAASEVDARVVMQELMDAFAIREADAIRASYSELMESLAT